jgi:hypothetical protein
MSCFSYEAKLVFTSDFPASFTGFLHFIQNMCLETNLACHPYTGKYKHVYVFTVSTIDNHRPENSRTAGFYSLSLLHVRLVHAVHVLIAEQISLFAFWQKGRTR